MTRHVVIGTAGHIDHGKTALVRALTGTDTDRLAEEKRRGITIDLGFAHTTLPDGTSASIVDVPGHEDFIRNMVAGASGIDVALVVVAADEGVMPQTREHIDILRMLDVRLAVLALTRSDLVDAEWLELATDDLRSHVAATPYANAPIVPVSARSGDGLEELQAALVRALAAGSEPGAERVGFRLPVDRGFTVHGTGTVVTGAVRDGSIAVGDELVVLPAGRRARVRALQRHGQAVDRVGRGMRAAVALTGVDRDDVPRGSWVVSPDWPITPTLTARIELVPHSAWQLRQRQRVRVHVGTAEVMARVVLLDRAELSAGQAGFGLLRLEAPVVVKYGDRFVVRSYSPVTTIGGGVVLEPTPTVRRRVDTDTLAYLDALARSPSDALPVAVARSGLDGVAIDELPFRFGAPAQARVDGVLVSAQGRLYARALLDGATTALAAAVDDYHARHPLRAGIERSDARRACALPAGLADVVIDRAVSDGVLAVRGGLLGRPGFEPRPDVDQAATLERLMRVYVDAGLAAPTIEDLPAELRERPDLRDLLAVLERAGLLVPLGQDRLAAAAALAGARERMEAALGGRSDLAPGDFREVFDLPRKHLIPLLEHFDRLGWTRRAGEGRAVPQKSAETAHPVP
ncbi:MAG TPA: selenocysteine-specific translation elongation factor [Longimicrobiales bacterium]